MEVALVTGAGGGIGAALCRALAPRYRIVAAGRDHGRLAATVAAVKAAGGEAHSAAFDLTDAAGTEQALTTLTREYGAPALLVANAGIAVSAPLGAEGSDELHRRHLDVNYHGARRVFEGLLPGWREAGGGCAVMVASSAALRGYAYVAAYAASKHALLGYARSAALELARHRVAVHVVCPYYVDSPMTDASAARIAAKTGRSAAEAREVLAAQNPGGRLVTPDEVAAAVLQLVASDRTGVVVELPGGAPIEVEAGQPLP